MSETRCACGRNWPHFRIKTTGCEELPPRPTPVPHPTAETTEPGGER